MQSFLIAGKRLNELGGLLGHPIWRVDLGAHTVRQPIAAMADTAVDILMRGIRRQDATPVDKVLAHTLVKRGSVAKPPAG